MVAKYVGSAHYPASKKHWQPCTPVCKADTLAELNCSSKYCGIDQKGISKLKYIKKLDCGDNPYINDISHIAHIIEDLDCSGDCGLKQHNILGLKKIEKINCESNGEIVDVNHLSDTLKELTCGWQACGIDQNGMHSSLTLSVLGISELKKLKVLNCPCNSKINNVNHLSTSLEILDCSSDEYNSFCGIDQNGISELEKLKVLDCRVNDKITNVNHLKNTLEELDCSYGCGIDQNGFNQTKIRVLAYYGYENGRINNISFLKNTLQYIQCYKDCDLAQIDISKFVRLIKIIEH